MNQTEQIRAHLERKPITAIEALKHYRCFRLAARILELRASGLNVVADMVHKGGKRFARYRLA
jgi:Helix-turn-helix domain